MNLRPLSERSEAELKYLVELADKTSIGSALCDHGIDMFDLEADTVGRAYLMENLEEVDRRELESYWTDFVETGYSVMITSNHKWIR